MSTLTRAVLALAMTGVASGCATLLDFQQPEDDGTAAAAASSDASNSADATFADDATLATDARDSARSDSADPDAAAVSTDAGSIGSGADSGASLGDDAAADAGTVATGACVSTPPAAWDGPFAIDEMNGNGPAPACPVDYPVAAFDGFDVPIGAAAQCSCSCSAPVGATCGSPTVSYYTDFACQQANGNTTLASASCTKTDKSGGAKFLKVAAPPAVGGTCTPVASATVPSLQITASVRLCVTAAPPSQGSCATDQVALPSVAVPFEKGNACITRDGSSWTCPASYPIGHTYYSGLTDARACSTCVCDAPTSTTCTTSATDFTDLACAANAKSLTAGICTTIGQIQSVSITTAPAGGSCNAHGGIPTGVVTPASPKTVCCVL